MAAVTTARVRTLWRADRRDAGSLPLALLLTFVGAMLSALMVPMVLTQIHTTDNNASRADALDAAEAGLDTGIGHIRAADDSGGTGTLAALPCGPLAGDLNGSGTPRYQVTIAYFDADPHGHETSSAADTSWRAAHQIQCIPGGGTYSTPAFALLTATGTKVQSGSIDAVSGRTLLATYTFRTTNQNIPGGLIHVYKTSTSIDLCIDAGSSAPTTGTRAQMQRCSPGSLAQTFAYNTDLTLVLASSKTSAQPLGMCLDAGSSPETKGNIIQLRPCVAPAPAQQQWSFNNSANFEGTTDGKTTDGLCFNVQSQNVPGSFLVLGSGLVNPKTCYQGYDNIETFSPEPAVGAGMAGPSTGQLVNFAEFGRCLDVTEQNVSKGYQIVWPCKQAPDPSTISWNQRWTLPAITSPATSATGQISTNNGTAYCLTSPLSTAAGKYVTLTACPKTLPASMKWTVYGDTKDLSSNYQIRDSAGNCLAPTDPTATPPDFYTGGGTNISKVVVATCSTSSLLKWNAPANVMQTLPLKDIGEK